MSIERIKKLQFRLMCKKDELGDRDSKVSLRLDPYELGFITGCVDRHLAENK